MTIAEFIKVLQKLPGDREVVLLAASGHARPPMVEPIMSEGAWGKDGCWFGGLENTHNAYLVRPEREIVGLSGGRET